MKYLSIILLLSASWFMVPGEIHAQPDPRGMAHGHDFEGMHRIRPHTDSEYRNYFITDSAYVYRWDQAGSEWQLYQVQYYSYAGGRLDELLTRSYESGAGVALTRFTYNHDGRAEASANYTWSGEWIPSTRYLNEYDDQGRVISLRLQKWSGGAWTEERLQQNYQYDISDRAIRYETIYWRSNAWTQPTVSELSYNETGQLEYHLATRPNGAVDYRIVYEYDDSGRMTQFYTQYPAGDGWSNWNLRSFHYDGCGERRYQVQYTGRGPDWIPSTKTEFFTTFSTGTYPGRKVPVCHKGHTIWVAAEAVPAHLRHGDCIGECRVEDGKHGKQEAVAPFSVWPNPARESITVSFSDDCDCRGRRLELTDFAGKIIRSYRVSDDQIQTIERGNLRPGRYFIRLTGKDVFSLPLILE